jgi:hypothetical protein
VKPALAIYIYIYSPSLTRQANESIFAGKLTSGEFIPRRLRPSEPFELDTFRSDEVSSDNLPVNVGSEEGWFCQLDNFLQNFDIRNRLHRSTE